MRVARYRRLVVTDSLGQDGQGGGRGSRAGWGIRAAKSETGAGAALAMAIIGATTAIAIALIGVVGVFAAHTAASVAADAAALAAADTASHRVPGDPCGRAAVVASLHQTSLQACSATRTESVVTVNRDLGWFSITASAKAGLPR